MKVNGMRLGSRQMVKILKAASIGPSAFNRCVGGKLRGVKGSKADRMNNFTKAAESCKGTKGK